MSAPELLGHVLEVERVVPETADALSVWFTVPPELRDIYSFSPGQFLTLAIPSERTGRVARCYSISSSPRQAGIAVTVKRTAGGYASNWVCDNLVAGSALRVLPPSGLFTPRSPEADLVLCAAGSGITPVMSILRTVLDSVTGRVALFYANRDPDSIIFDAELRALAAAAGDRLSIEHWLESERGLPTGEGFAGWAGEYRERELFVCGPQPFMLMVKDGARNAGFDVVRVRLEEFRSLSGDPFVPITEFDADSLSDAALAEVTLDDELHTLPWPTNHTLIDALAVAGLEAPYACREGKCGACACRLADGTLDLGRTDALEPDDIADGYFLACQAKPTARALKVEF